MTDSFDNPAPYGAALPPALSVAQIKEAEQRSLALASDDILMDRAARAVARVVKDALVASDGGVLDARVVVLAGSGKNGGDALLAGALLADQGAVVTAVEVAASAHARGRREVAAAGARVLNALAESGLRAAEAALREADVVIDGIAGLGGTPGLRAPADRLVTRIAKSTLVVAVDLPSGLDADSGTVTGTHVVADITVAFTAPTWCLVTPPASAAAGRVVVADVGVDLSDTRPGTRPVV